MKQYKLSKAADFTGQSIFVGIDVHLRSWKIAIDTEAMSFKRFSQDPNPDLLADYLHRLIEAFSQGLRLMRFFSSLYLMSLGTIYFRGALCALFAHICVPFCARCAASNTKSALI